MKRLQTLILPLGAALALTLAAGPALRAQAPQEHAPATTAHAAPAHETAAPADTAHAAGAPAAHSTAAHEGDGHAAAAHEGDGHGAAAAHAGSGHKDVTLFGHSLGTLGKFGVQVFNFAIFAAILVFLLKSTLAAAFKARTQELEAKLSQAERDKAEAKLQLQELDSRMTGLQQELEGIMAKAETDAEAEKVRILDSAKAEAAQILAQTQADILFQKRQAEDELRALVAELAVAGATRRLETALAGGQSARVLDQAIDQVGGAK